CQQGYTYPFTF
nr:immunoglobulin light chain junction region [Macaca mulatta]MOV80576.1 immunoglobulin light chain junction region [Macaca mulatta]MOV81933.1 immunoglobulin light chain junction region [Macaca mulatta]MOV84260.1 immunoglobulin light chain junction region [Macaca mulatta]MOV84270.1 immunoglobulin light chain junction region [Macaca mulatta]